MATSSLASAASSFMLSANTINNTTTRTSFIAFNKTNSKFKRLVVRAEEGEAPPPVATTETKEAVKPPPPPPIGPKRALVSQGHASYSLGKEKVTHLHFFYQENLSGDHPTAVLVAKPNNTTINAFNLASFGEVYVLDTPLTETQDPNSKVVGQLQGLSVSVVRDGTILVFMVDLGFTSGEFNGSSVSVLSRNPILETNYRELAVVGGRGKFRMARGFAELHTTYMNATSSVVIVEYNVTVFHYE
ncbi:dirigent protein 4-like [Dioscorea cayenensis subsp. rotundata]|uniref:Dirigent protein n=1 Tax=Dioscorea cayennensis subsp. rotundata TaxID=55577 RepID=A0AB40C3N7_DIOCR|nr:dirigent protein 4-like [Dioscorea cayenensis subsp. rotundata]